MSNERTASVCLFIPGYLPSVLKRIASAPGSLLERLNTTTSSKSAPLLHIGCEEAIGPIEPPTELLTRIQSFLAAIATSNEVLSQENPEDIDIENVPENVEQYIEMNLGLGVFETKRPKSGSRSVTPSSEAESSSDETLSESESYSSCSDSEEGSESSSSSYDSDAASGSESQSGSSVDIKLISSRPIKPLPRRVSQQAKMEV
ncbi:hypothetical protein JVU11DRAFT_1935 [Chiua virens]|nr:hypothetical protein JVU11DRAFT_1935 [Chiua virens]